MGGATEELCLNFWLGQDIILLSEVSRPVWPTKPSGQVGAGDLQQMEGGQTVKLTVHLHQMPRFRMNGTSAYAFMVFTGTTLPHNDYCA